MIDACDSGGTPLGEFAARGVALVVDGLDEPSPIHGRELPDHGLSWGRIYGRAALARPVHGPARPGDGFPKSSMLCRLSVRARRTMRDRMGPAQWPWDSGADASPVWSRWRGGSYGKGLRGVASI